MWDRFRSWPWWAQALLWLVAWPVPLAMASASRPREARPWWWAGTAAATLVWGAAAFAPDDTAGDEVATLASAPAVSSTTTEPVAAPTTSTTQPSTTTTTEPPPTTAAPTTTLPPTTLPPATLPAPTAPPATVPVTEPVHLIDPAQSCGGYSPCIPPDPDVDCAGGSGNGPRYVQGPVRVDHAYGDPYDLDRDRDGIGCER